MVSEAIATRCESVAHISSVPSVESDVSQNENPKSWLARQAQSSWTTDFQAEQGNCYVELEISFPEVKYELKEMQLN